MKLSEQIRSVSYLKANAAGILGNTELLKCPMIITQNGEAKAVLQSVDEYERTQETIAMLKILALGNRQIEQGLTEPAASVVQRLKNAN